MSIRLSVHKTRDVDITDVLNRSLEVAYKSEGPLSNIG